MQEGREIPTTFMVPRHTKKTKSAAEGSSTSGEFYPGITPEGEEIVREKTRNEVMEVVENSEPGSVIIFGGASDYVRTKSSARVSGNELKKLLADRPDEYLVLEEKDIDELRQKDIASRAEKTEEERRVPFLNALRNVVAENANKKIVLVYPLYMEELSMDEKDKGRMADEPRWKSGGSNVEKWGDYLIELMRRNNDDEYAGVVDWVNNGGKMTASDGTELEGPKAEETAQNYITAMRRLESVAQRLFPNRPLVLAPVGHSWDIDVFITQLAKGELNAENLKEIATGTSDKQSIISEFEFPVIRKAGNKITVDYRGKTYEVNNQVL